MTGVIHRNLITFGSKDNQISILFRASIARFPTYFYLPAVKVGKRASAPTVLGMPTSQA